MTAAPSRGAVPGDLTRRPKQIHKPRYASPEERAAAEEKHAKARAEREAYIAIYGGPEQKSNSGQRYATREEAAAAHKASVKAAIARYRAKKAAEAAVAAAAAAATKPKPKRGRRPAATPATAAAPTATAPTAPTEGAEPKLRRRPGRPRKEDAVSPAASPRSVYIPPGREKEAEKARRDAEYRDDPDRAKEKMKRAYERTAAKNAEMGLNTSGTGLAPLIKPKYKAALEFELTPKQHEANRLLGSEARHIMLRGGARSGKSFLLIRAMVMRALRAPGTTHVVLRLHFNHLKASIIGDTLPKVMRLCYPNVKWVLNKSDWFADFPGGSKILFGGLDDAERTEKILGQEHSTILFNECSQISYSARNTAITRLAQHSDLELKAYYDCNPPTVGHWTYRMFEMKVEPISGKAWSKPESYATMMMNPGDNLANLPPDYITTLQDLPEKERHRYLMGQYLSAVEGALWSMEMLEKTRRSPEQVKAIPMVRVVIGVDPSGCSGEEDERSDEIGIVAMGMDQAGNGYLLEDASGRYSPDGWARKVIELYDKHRADRIIAERNFGGAMVEFTIRSARASAPVELITASRGKVQRAEPIAALYEQNRMFHIDAFPELEEQLLQFSTSGYKGSKSPDRADALVWAATALMLGAQAVSPIIGRYSRKG